MVTEDMLPGKKSTRSSHDDYVISLCDLYLRDNNKNI